jgi:hypothetical protein
MTVRCDRPAPSRETDVPSQFASLVAAAVLGAVSGFLYRREKGAAQNARPSPVAQTEDASNAPARTEPVTAPQLAIAPEKNLAPLCRMRRESRARGLVGCAGRVRFEPRSVKRNDRNSTRGAAPCFVLHPLMNCLRLFALLACSLSAVAAASPLYRNDFESAEIGQTPKEFLIIAGTFTVQQEAGNKFLELPGAPLDTFGFLFGPTQGEGASISARFFGTSKGRKFPTFGVSLNGAGGYRLQVSAAKKALEIFNGDEARANAPFEWPAGKWTSLRIQLRKTPAGSFVVEGKAWPADAPEPEQWTISLEERSRPAPGRPGIWGSPYSGTPIRFDDLALTQGK